MTAFRTVLFVVGYPAAIIVIVRWVPVVREPRTSWFAVHTVAMSAVVAGWLLDHRWSAVAVNGAWLVGSVLWFTAAGRRPAGHL